MSEQEGAEPRLTVAIPLHGAARWIDTVVQNVKAAPAASRVVISDASHIDRSADRLARTFAGDARVSVVKRTANRGWIDHANLLLEEAGTEYFCWMPQDDLVSPHNYFDRLVGALEREPDRVLAFPAVSRRVTRGRLRRREIEPLPYRRPPIELGQRPPEVEAVELLRRWNLGLGCWRGVFRRSLARPIPATNDCADLIWAFSMALAGNFIEVPQARYLKRLRKNSTHRQMRWQGREEAWDLYRAEIEARLPFSDRTRDEVLGQVDGHLRRHRHSRMIHGVRAAGAFVLRGSRPVLE